MRGLLLDTHAFLWFIYDDARLSAAAARHIEDASTQKLLSAASLWEIVVKAQLGKLQLGMPMRTFFDEHVRGRELEVLDIELEHLLAYDALPLLHRDPFDRLLVAQARALNMPIVSADANLALYDVEIIW